MRVLVATTAGSGHFGPLLPFARALRDCGHLVEVAAPASFGAAVERSGFAHLPFSDVAEGKAGAVYASLPGRTREEMKAVVLGEVFGRLNTEAALPAMEAMVAQRRPDIVLRESGEFSSYLAAEAAGIPHAQVEIGLASFHQGAEEILEAPLVALGATPGLAGLRTAPRLSLTPPSFEDPSAPVPPETARFRDDGGGGPDIALPDWWPGSSDPLVYVTFGSVAGSLGLYPELYRDVITAVADLPVRVLLTVGEGADPSLLDPVPAGVHVERWWPQGQVMGAARAMVGHGGFGTTLMGLASGTPMIVLPLFADQPDNARRVHALGAGIALEGGGAAIGGLAEALTQLLDDPSYRSAAQRIAEEIASLPPVAAAVPLIEAVAGV